MLPSCRVNTVENVGRQEMHREVIPKVALKEKKENAQGRSQQEVLSTGFMQASVYGLAVP